MSTYADRNSPMVVRKTARAKVDPSRGGDVTARRMTLRLPDDAWEALDSLAPEGERASLIAYLLRCERKRQLAGDDGDYSKFMEMLQKTLAGVP